MFRSFSDDWYTEYITQVIGRHPSDASSDSIAIAHAVMVAGAFISQAIDGHDGHIADKLDAVANSINSINSISELASAMTNRD